MKMAGHMGNRRITVKGVEIIYVDAERNLLLLKGGVPGATNWLLEIRRSSKPPVEPAVLFGLTQEDPAAEVQEPEAVQPDEMEQEATLAGEQEESNQQPESSDSDDPPAEGGGQ